ncbi:hypothetical protein LguiA_025927 [Lonicera macranthoides]
MGCSSSKLDDEEAVQLCKDRKNFIKQAVEYRIQFASNHIAYIQSLKRVSVALKDYIEGDEPREFLLDSYRTPTFTTPVKKMNPEFISISQIQSVPHKSYKINYLRSGGNSSVTVEERPQSPETVRVESYSQVPHYGMDGIFAMQSSPMSSSIFHYSPNERANSSIFHYSPNERPSFPPPSPRNSQWDFFWNPFSSLDYYGYPNRSSLDQSVLEDEINGLRQVREEEGIPELEEETEQEERQVSNQETAVANQESNEETPGFTVYVNRRPTNMGEVIKDLEAQFTIICKCANEVSAILDASRAQYSSTSNELTAMKMLNPVALLRSASSRSNSSRFLMNSSSASKDEGYESSSDFSDESCMFSGSHQSTLDKLLAWEKKLYQQVRAGERVRMAYEKKCKQLTNQDVKGDDPFSVDKTRTAIRDLHTQIKVSIHKVEAVSKSIEVLRDEELQPQLLELIQGLSKMWKVMAECHQSQKRTLDDAKLLLAGTPSKTKKKYTIMSPSEPHRLARSAAQLETELRNWRACFDLWITSQISYVHALTGWVLRCAHSETDSSKLPLSPRQSTGAPPIFGICIKWSRVLDAVGKVPVLDGLDFFAAGVGSLYAQQLREDSRRNQAGQRLSGGGSSSGGMELVEVVVEEEVMSVEKMAEVAVKVLCAGMSVAVSSLTEFALGSAEGYAELAKEWEGAKWQQNPAGA